MDTYRNRVLLAVLLLTWLALPLHAHQVALKSGRVIHFEKYRVGWEKLFYIGQNGMEIAIPLNEIDVDRTRQLNAQEPVPLDLPGMASLSSQQNQNAAPSLGEIARKAKGSEKSTSKRIFTDDDVTHSVNILSSGSVDSSSATASQVETTLDTAEAYANSLADKTERQLSEMEVGDVQFPGRDRWEPKLFAQKEELVKTIRTAVYAAREYLNFIRAKEGSGALSKDEQLKLQESRKAVQSQIDNIRVARYRFDQLVSEGVREAAEWKRTINR